MYTCGWGKDKYNKPEEWIIILRNLENEEEKKKKRKLEIVVNQCKLTYVSA